MKRISTYLLWMLFVALSFTFYASATTNPWLSTPSTLTQGDDIVVMGGGAPGNTKLTIKVYDVKTGELVTQTQVFTKSSGAFELNLGPIDATNFEIKTFMSGIEVSSVSSLSEK